MPQKPVLEGTPTTMAPMCVVPAEDGDGGARCARTLVAEIATPSLRHSPTMRR